MSRFLLVLIFLFLVFSPVVNAEEPTRAERLDQLFVELKQAKNEAEGRATEDQIWRLWTTPEDPELRTLMQQVLEARRWREFDRALDLLEKIIAIQPDYAEAWNQQAIVYFAKQDFEQSLEAVAKALEYEPRHFAALAGRGVIRLFQGRSALAIQNFKAAMKFHPFLKERTMVPPQFQDEPVVQ